jgi:hypothetical protein
VVRRRDDGAEVRREPVGDPTVPGDVRHVQQQLETLAVEDSLREWRV